MPPDSIYPAPVDTATFMFPAEWQAFAELLGGSNTGLLFLQNGSIIHVNRNLARQLGFSETELVGLPVGSLFPSGKDMNTHEHARLGGRHIQLVGKNKARIDFDMVVNRIGALPNASCTIWVLQPTAPASKRHPLSADAQRAQAIISHLPDLVFICDTDTSLTYASRSFNATLGYGGEELIGAKLADLVHQEDRLKLLAALTPIAASDAAAASSPIIFRIKHCNGSWRHLSARACNLLAEPAVAGLLLNGQDITERYLQQQSIATEKKRQLHYLNRLFRMARQPHANLASELKVILKAAAKALSTHRCAYWEVSETPSATHCVMAYDDIRQSFVDEEKDTTFDTVFHPLLYQVAVSERALIVADVDQDPRAALYCEYFHAVCIKASMIVPVWCADKVVGLLVIYNFNQARQWRKDEADFADNVAGLIALIFKEVERGRAEAQLRHLAHHDSLTGLPNRHFLFDQAADIFPKATAESNSLAAFFIDLDGFKNINDSLGHAVGDELLKAVALRLKNVVRKDDILVRLGGDEFMLLARNLSDMRIADDIAAQVVETMRGTFSLQGRELRISASVGIALYPFDGADIETLMKKADIAMYHAKSAGRDQYRMFAPRLDDGVVNRSALENELRRAIEERELQHYYQPQVDLRTRKVRCVEALLRWHHPRHGMLLPASFLPVAEESGLIHHISKWVLNDACDQLNAWSRQGHDLKIAINLSASQLMDRALLPALESALDRTGVAGHQLEWEIKESTAMQHNTMTSSMLDHVTDLRIGLSIDDFGTGYSNMAYLRRHPVYKIKIDSSFVDGLPGEGDNRAITDAIISMARPLGLHVVAEGVETPQQMEYLRERGCDIAQGYFFTQPLTAEQFEKWLLRH